MLPDQADFAKTNGFKVLFGFWQGNTLIQHNILRIPGFFVQNRVGYTNPIPTSDSSPPSFSPVTHREGLCASFKTRFGKMYHEASILARWANMKQRHFSPNQPIWPGSKSVQVKEVMLENA